MAARMESSSLNTRRCELGRGRRRRQGRRSRGRRGNYRCALRRRRRAWRVQHLIRRGCRSRSLGDNRYRGSHIIFLKNGDNVTMMSARRFSDSEIETYAKISFRQTRHALEAANGNSRSVRGGATPRSTHAPAGGGRERDRER